MLSLKLEEADEHGHLLTTVAPLLMAFRYFIVDIFLRGVISMSSKLCLTAIGACPAVCVPRITESLLTSVNSVSTVLAHLFLLTFL